MDGNGTGERQVTVIQALRAVLQEDFDDDLAASRIVIQPMGTGQVPYRLHPRGGGDYVGGVAVVELSRD